jgi:hypothetical protein
VDHVPVVVTDDLHLDVARPLDVALDDHRSVPERPLRLVRCFVEGGGELVRAPRDADALAPSAGGGLHEHGVPDGTRRRRQVGEGLRRVEARDDRHAGCVRETARLDLRPHGIDG